MTPNDKRRTYSTHADGSPAVSDGDHPRHPVQVDIAGESVVLTAAEAQPYLTGLLAWSNASGAEVVSMPREVWERVLAAWEQVVREWQYETGEGYEGGPSDAELHAFGLLPTDDASGGG